MIDYRIPPLDGPFAVIETPSDAPQIIRDPKSLPSLRLTNIRKKLIIALPQQLDCHLTCWITKEIFKELVELFSRIVSSMTVNNGNDGFGNIIPSTLYAS
ncbi:MAG: hypothetical protein M3264_06705 [Thermoproteota archaeon]|nr:hypothetical protein [Thermoproteota archaeon]